MIDGGIFLGRNPATGVSLDAEAALKFMNESGIQSAVAVSYKSVFFDFREGNSDVLNLVHKYPGRFIPSVFVQPSGFDVFKDQDYFPELARQGARILNLFSTPKYYDILWQSPLVEEIVANASKAGLTIQLGIASLAEILLLPALIRKIKVPVLLRWTGGRAYHALAEILNLGKLFPHLHFDLASVTPSGAIKHLVDTLGADRFYLASGSPETLPLCSLFVLETSGISSDDILKIKTGNLSRILNWDCPQSPRPESNLQNQLKQFSQIPKIDTHWHTGGWNILEPQKHTDFFPEQMRRFNIQKIILSSIRALNYDPQEGNAELFRWAETQDGAYALIVLDPRRPEKSLEDIHRYAQHPKCAGLKTIQDLYGLGLDAPAYKHLLDAGFKAGLPVMAHIPGMSEAAKTFPDMNFICAHATYERVSKMIPARNIFFDIATSHNDAAETQLARLVQEAGEDRIIFASDAPLMDPSWTLAKIADARLNPSHWEKIFYLNALKAFPRLNAASTPLKTSL